jgi:hypothetical protein
MKYEQQIETLEPDYGLDWYASPNRYFLVKRIYDIETPEDVAILDETVNRFFNDAYKLAETHFGDLENTSVERRTLTKYDGKFQAMFSFTKHKKE